MPLTKKSDAGDYVDDFQKSKAPQFKGKSKKKKRQMAIAAYLSNKNELAKVIREAINEADPKKGTGKKPKGSSRRLYTDEDPSDTVRVKFSTRQDIVDTLAKKTFKSKSHARQSQIINLIHQRTRAAYGRTKDPKKKKRLKSALDYITSRKEASKRKTQRMKKEEVLTEISVLGFLKNLGKETIANIKSKILKVWNTAREEGGETYQMFNLMAAKKKGKKLTAQQQKLIDDQAKDLIKMAVLGTGAASAFSALPITAAAATLVSIISFLDLDDDLLSYTDSSKDSARSLTAPEKDPKNFKDIQGVKYIKYDAVAPYLSQADAVAEETDINSENFKDGKKKGKSRPGRVKKAGASCKGSVTSLRAKAKKYGGEKGKMYHWCANMKSGKKK